MQKSLEDLQLSNDELSRLGKAFKDPEFCKLFSQYAEELNDPENKRRYEEEIKIAESGRGMDVQFINPTAFCVLKTRSWPSLGPRKPIAPSALKLNEGQKMFINICSCDKLQKPEVKSNGDGCGAHFSIPHSFSPPTEDIDKDKQMSLVVDVVFHPESIRLCKTPGPARNLIYCTAVEGVQKQFGFYLGPTKEHAKLTWFAKTAEANEKNVLSAFHLLKGVPHKGALRATVIRRKRDDFDDCQRQYKEAEKAVFEEARRGPNAKETLAALSKYKRCVEETLANPEGDSTATGDLGLINGKYKRPEYKVIHSSEFDMIDYRYDTSGEGPTTRPKLIKVEICLPGIDSCACIDLDVTEKNIHLQCEKPRPYLLDLALPYSIDSELAKAKFNKATNRLLLTMPVVIEAENTKLPSIVSDESIPAPRQKTVEALIQVVSSTSAEPDSNNSGGKRKRKKKKKKNAKRNGYSAPPESANTSVGSREQSSEAKEKSDSTPPLPPPPPPSAIQTRNSVKMQKSPSSMLIVPKTHSLASVRIRQDPASFTVILAVKNVLPDSLELTWSGGDCYYPVEAAAAAPVAAATPPTSRVLRFMLTCASRGGGACTLDWGIVLHCPAPRLHSNGETQSQVPIEAEGERAEPKLVCCDFSDNNVALTFAKPEASDWWESIAIGRALGPGLQSAIYQRNSLMFAQQRHRFVGSPTPTPWYCVGQLAGLVEVPVLAIAPQFLNIRQQQQHQQQSSQASSTPSRSNLRVAILSSDCVEITAGHVQSPPLSADEGDSAGEEEPTVTTQPPKERRQGSDAGLPLKGILKQRSISECSVDGILPPSLLAVASSQPSARQHCRRRLSNSSICSEDFPTNNNDEAAEAIAATAELTPHTRPAYSSCGDESDNVFLGTSGGGGGYTRHRLHSVNFFDKDENVAFSPHDPVETLHHLLRNKAKNLRRSERRRRHNSYTSPSITMNELGGGGTLLTHKLKRQQRRKIKQDHSSSDSCVKQEKNTSSDAKTDAGGSTKTSLSSENEHIGSATAPSKPTITTAGGTGLLNWHDLPGGKCLLSKSQVEANPTINPHATICPVSLTADVIFELDED